MPLFDDEALTPAEREADVRCSYDEAIKALRERYEHAIAAAALAGVPFVPPPAPRF